MASTASRMASPHVAHHTLTRHALTPALLCCTGEPIAYVAETEAELEEAKAKASGGNGAAAAPAPAPVEAAAPVQVCCPLPRCLLLCVHRQGHLIRLPWTARLAATYPHSAR